MVEIRKKVQEQPTAVCHIPQALKYLVTTETLLNDAPEVNIIKKYSHKLYWSQTMRKPLMCASKRTILLYIS